MTEKQNAEMLDLADKIEASNGLILMVPGQGTVQIGIRKTALAIAALRAAPSPHPRREEMLELERRILAGVIDRQPRDHIRKIFAALRAAAPSPHPTREEIAAKIVGSIYGTPDERVWSS